MSDLQCDISLYTKLVYFFVECIQATLSLSPIFTVVVLCHIVKLPFVSMRIQTRVVRFTDESIVTAANLCNCFAPSGVSRDDLIDGGLEVILYDHHKFSHDNNIGGLRMCVPRKKISLQQLNRRALSATNSPLGSRGSSPILLENGK